MRHHTPRCHAALFLALCFSAAGAGSAAAAQQRNEPSLGYMVRVSVAEASIFAQADARSPLVGRVRSGDTLVVTGKTTAWYKVRIPRDRRLTPTGPASGYIDVKSVVVAGPGGGPVGVAGPAGQSQARPTTGARGWGGLQLRPFANLAFQAFTASNSFKATFGSATGLLYGGGLDMAIGRSLRLSGSVTHFQKTGERAFAYNGDSFQLGIPDRVSITPIDIDVTFRVDGKRYTPYIGAGAGAVLYRETSDFAQPGDNVSKTGTAFQVLGGVEIPVAHGFSVAVEAQYQSVRGVLGDTGVSQAFKETDLGGASVRLRLILGR